MECVEDYPVDTESEYYECTDVDPVIELLRVEIAQLKVTNAETWRGIKKIAVDNTSGARESKAEVERLKAENKLIKSECDSLKAENEFHMMLARQQRELRGR